MLNPKEILMKRIWLVLWALLLLLAGSKVVLGQLSYTTNADGINFTVTGYSRTPSCKGLSTFPLMSTV